LSDFVQLGLCWFIKADADRSSGHRYTVAQ
jgi:hypothetical protein